MKRVLMTHLAACVLCSLGLMAAPAVAVDSFVDVYTGIAITAPPFPTPPALVFSGISSAGVFVPTQ